ncbi:uncharacterized protein LOC117648338 [Thrips palmi]|uniref:Uncharacterized protein LOC117648338 n=1 Tax=Thrips palmi TaxID=161013 RepID=A0A6P8ZCS7_THRPL|nr:uncharacterized protein LOC117648338 [Thrips palmi]
MVTVIDYLDFQEILNSTVFTVKAYALPSLCFLSCMRRKVQSQPRQSSILTVQISSLGFGVLVNLCGALTMDTQWIHVLKLRIAWTQGQPLRSYSNTLRGHAVLLCERCIS